MKLNSIVVATLLAVVPGALTAEVVPSLRGSAAGMQVQNRIAKNHGLTFYRTNAEIREAVEAGTLVELTGNEDYEVADFVNLPYLQPAAALFVERLAAQYREACGQKLVVTSAVRATSRQPANAHALSVHPAGMAVDLRVSDRAQCRSWLENAILGMERNGLIDGIREYHPPHYHIAVFPTQYMEYALERQAREEAEALALEAANRAEAERASVAVPQGASALVAEAPDADARADQGFPREAGIALMMVLLPVGIGYFAHRRRRTR